LLCSLLLNLVLTYRVAEVILSGRRVLLHSPRRKASKDWGFNCCLLRASFCLLALAIGPLFCKCLLATDLRFKEARL
jgi:hypothetical protein